MHQSHICSGYFENVEIVKKWSGSHKIYSVSFIFKGILLWYRPSLSLKVGMPLFLETPAPVKTHIRFALMTRSETIYKDYFFATKVELGGGVRGLAKIFYPIEVIRLWKLLLQRVILWDFASKSSFTYWIEVILSSIFFINS